MYIFFCELHNSNHFFVNILAGIAQPPRTRGHQVIGNAGKNAHTHDLEMQLTMGAKLARDQREKILVSLPCCWEYSLALLTSRS